MIALNFETQIKGSCTLANHDKWIDVASMSFAVNRTMQFKSAGADRTTSVAHFSEVNLSRMVDIASADLFAQSISGESLGKATIDLIRSDVDTHKTYMQIILHDPIITSYNISSGGGETAMETLTINFTKISVEYNDNGVDQSQQKGWDLTKSTKLAA
ncbi:MAG: type VI secretion system tube protein Hcp [Planctomycetaceae bacterium]|nr:type VI secretion system tube protein Hcp [Planctomycetaceae bacterium]